MRGKPSRCILHIGMHKTGSTSIQDSLQALSNDDFFYPQFGTASHHNIHLPAVFSSSAEKLVDGRRKVGKTIQHRDYQADIAKAIAAARGRTLILSSEGLYASLSADDINRLKTFLDDTFDDYKLVAYARPPGPLMASRFQQRIRSGGCNRFKLALRFPLYKAKFEPFDLAFGRERVHIWKFDTSAFPGGDVVKDFCGKLGIELPDGPVRKSNQAMSREITALFYIYNRYCEQANVNAKRQRRSKSQALKLLRDTDGTRFRLSPRLIDPVIARNSEELRWIEERTGACFRDEEELTGQNDIAAEEDLMRVDPSLLSRLKAATPSPLSQEDPNREAALLVHALGQMPD